MTILLVKESYFFALRKERGIYMMIRKNAFDINGCGKGTATLPNRSKEQNEQISEVCRYIDENRNEDSFRKTLFRFIDTKGFNDVDVYKKARLTRNVFHCIKKTENYQVSKKTAIKFAIALELTNSEAEELLNSAGFSLNHSSPFDLIIMYHLDHHIYDVIRINDVLEDLLGVIL